jgi:beta-mannosidase
MQCISLDGDWQLSYFREGEHAIDHPDQLAAAGAPTIAARVPGNVELDLVRAGVLPDPFYAANIRLLRPFEFYEWWYAREFTLPADAAAQPWDLVCAGLDTIATIWINGVEVGRAANMLIEHRFDVSAALRPGQTNRIVIRLGSAINYARRFHYDAVTAGPEHRDEMVWLRKAAHMGGWDIMPRALGAGIWRSLWLEPRPATAIEQVYYWTSDIGPEGATLGARWQFRTDAPTLDGFTVRFHGVCGDHTFDYEWPTEFIADHCAIPVPGARLWWPRGYGDPNLYTVVMQVCQHGQVVAERRDRIGIRKLVVDRTATAGAAWTPDPPAVKTARIDSPPDPTSHFVFYVNDEPIQVRGANWVPLDAFHSRDAERVEQAVALFADLGCNMIRCWGGNVYEDHRFFDLCDEAGILVWQDFAFACAIYPQTEEFLAQVRAEVVAVAEKLRNHPSLAIWCGDNEIDGFYVWAKLSPAQNRLTREVIPQALHRCDPHRAYVPSSPYVPPVLDGEENVWMRTPEQHLWGPRGYFKSPFYTQHSAHFIGEIGYHGCNNVSSIRRFISPENLWPWDKDGWNDEWQVHAVYHWQHRAIDRDRIKLMANQVRELFGEIPDDLESFALASQISQAEAKKFFIESTRLRKWRTSGILWWNVIDGWPQFSDAIVDYYFSKKLAYEYIWRVQRPVCVIIGEPGTGKHLPVVICNDTRQPATVDYAVRDAESEEVVAAGTFTVPAGQNWQVDRIRTYASDQKLYLITWEIAGKRFGNHYLAGRPPFALERYRRWLAAIAALPRPFAAEAVGR